MRALSVWLGAVGSNTCGGLVALGIGIAMKLQALFIAAGVA